MWAAIEVLLGLYAALVGFIFLFQRRLMYHPLKAIEAPAVYGLAAVRDVFLDAPDGVKLETWIQDARDGFPTLVYFHGNAVHLGDRAYKFNGFTEAGFGLVAVSYRGFGRSGGGPSEAGIYNDARASIAYAREVLKVPPEKLIYFGESLGSGVAVQMALEQPPALLVLESAYTSVETRSAELYPFVLGVKRLVHDKYDSLSKIARVHAPLLMLHGRKDAIIPVAHAHRLFEAANEPKQLIIYDEVHHTDYTVEQLVMPVLNAAGKFGLLPG